MVDRAQKFINGHWSGTKKKRHNTTSAHLRGAPIRFTAKKARRAKRQFVKSTVHVTPSKTFHTSLRCSSNTDSICCTTSLYSHCSTSRFTITAVAMSMGGTTVWYCTFNRVYKSYINESVNLLSTFITQGINKGSQLSHSMNEAVLIRFMNSFLKVWEAPQQRCRFEMTSRGLTSLARLSQHTVTSSITSLILPRWGSLWRSLSAHHRHRGLNVILGTLFHHRPSSANVWICVRIMSCLETALKRSSGRKAPATYKQRRNHQMISCL